MGGQGLQGQPQGPSPLMMQALGVGQGVPMGFGSYGQEQMREIFRKMLAGNPTDPIPFGLPPTSIADMNKMLLMGYNQQSPLQVNQALQPPAARKNASPFGV